MNACSGALAGRPPGTVTIPEAWQAFLLSIFIFNHHLTVPINSALLLLAKEFLDFQVSTARENMITRQGFVCLKGETRARTRARKQQDQRSGYL